MGYESIKQEKEQAIINATGHAATSIDTLYNSLTGTDKALMRAGIWMAEHLKTMAVRENGVKNAETAANAIRPHFDHISGTEQLLALLMDNQNRPLAVVDVSGKRQPAGCDLDLRKLVKHIVLHEAAGIILAHNHPSGEDTASRADAIMTRDLSSTLSSMGTEVLDHLIFTPDGSHRRISW